MTEQPCAVAATTKLETPEGPITMATLARAPASVLTRTDDGQVRFTMIRGGQKIGDGVPVLRITLTDGRAFRVGAGQVLYKKGMQETPAADLEAGDELETVFAFPEGYVYRNDDGGEVTSTGAVAVRAVEPDGEADVYSFEVNLTGRFALSAGVLGKASAG